MSREKAQKIVDELFVNDAGQKARRLVLEIDDNYLAGGWGKEQARDLIERIISEPLDMILHCPNCGRQHVDAPEPSEGWNNPPHKSHKCRLSEGGCGTVWRPADVPTNGVARITTRGDADTWPNGD